MSEFVYDDDKDPFTLHEQTGGKTPSASKVIKGSLNEAILEALKKPPIDISKLNEENQGIK